MGGTISTEVVEKRLSTLVDRTVPASEELFWMQLIAECNLEEEQFFQLVTAEYLMKMHEKQHSNLVSLILQCVQTLKLFALQETSDLPSVRTALFFLTRVCATFNGVEISDMDRVWWEPLPAVINQNGDSPSSENDVQRQESILPSADMLDGKNLAETLLNVLGVLLFTQSFTLELDTVDPLLRPTPRRNRGIRRTHFWDNGVLSPGPRLSPATETIVHRIEVLQCLLACISSDLFAEAAHLKDTPNPWLDYVLSDRFPNSANFFFSLINVVVNFTTWTLLPYSGSLFYNPGDRLTALSLQILNVLFDHNNHGHPFSSVDNVGLEVLEDQNASSSISSDERSNIFLEYISYVGELRDFSVIFDGLSSVMADKLTAKSTILPYSQRDFSFQNSLFIFMFFLLEASPRFRSFVSRRPNLWNFMYPLLCLMAEKRDNSDELAFLQVGSRVVLLLSQHAEFAVSLSAPNVKYTAPAFLGQFEGNGVDFFITVVEYLLEIEQHPMLTYPLLKALVNVSPFVRSISKSGAQRLTKLFDLMSERDFIEHSPDQYIFTLCILEAFNNIFQYQYKGCESALYELLSRSRRVRILHNFGRADDDGQPEFKSLVSPPPDFSVFPSDVELRVFEAQPRISEIQRSENTESELRDASSSVSPETGIESSEEKPNVEISSDFRTDAWYSSIREEFRRRTQAILLALRAVSLKIDEIADLRSISSAEVMNLLETITLVDSLPVPHPILVFHYERDSSWDIFLKSYIWAQYWLVSENTTTDLFPTSQVRLIQVARNPQ